MKKIKLWFLMRKARSEYRMYHWRLDQLSCGATLGELVSPSALRHKIKFNETMDKIAKLDPKAPTTRL